ncbi:hypothetical protein A3K34_02110 [candidate division WWE3 bacterium RIFOXYC1_FULL_40_10]|uniref:Uncharacterized protein n=1 Tax=candidate division WWE3 bacterium RIFOXYA2_FULL_46_9 TaxID=1802636 RepID=A0A1F4VZP6_UNCKA|nr:MAG: hypothetical protein A3K58_02110 [candidate division WWE3 bacterium RIFOXYB1_FULL_40_22]OGC61649.1 MAG: hypothetical protein A3K37_02110 [candidate division WWE3 bacterium RIFOXYA1_FULL_40_11]OGC62646.1 MAG: hypothetical protein A2264_02105 [candidate division WWE3 bacterium RIFOXYA2_FULL_46_9]OGC64406.1 MAG: hypothetical protein A2326_02565 [candidate division WWE3 bacterium RIFOXYB2_FULL_41_6]OGC66032.1 MAG: hypothetical protein A3K34_02110 [candidate division WWE3 bacterium RIFOXYC1_
MIQKIKAPVTVISAYNHKSGQYNVLALKWDGETHKISKLGYRHSFKQGTTRYHVFSVSSDTAFFKLLLNTDNLSWQLEEISDGIPD